MTKETNNESIEVLEKRVSRGVIRRRAPKETATEVAKDVVAESAIKSEVEQTLTVKDVAPQPESQVKVQVNDQVSPDVSVASTPVVSTVVNAEPKALTPEVPAKTQNVAPVAEKATVPVATSPASKPTVIKKRAGLILDEDAKAKAALNVQKHLAQQTSAQNVSANKKADVQAPKTENATITKSADQVAGDANAPQAKIGTEVSKVITKKEPAPKREEKVLSFRDRIKGSIDLAKFNKPQQDGKKNPVVKAKTLGDAPAGDGTATLSEDDEKNSAKEKAARPRKSVKDIGGDLDFEGLGRAENLSLLVRGSALDRVFNASSSGPKKKKIISKKNIKQTVITEKKASKRVIEIDQTITVSNMAQQLGVKVSEVIKHLMGLGVMATANQTVDKDTASLVASEYKYEIKDISFNENALFDSEESAEQSGESRPPVVTIMGHVDHGKTSLLDAIRSTNVVSGEAGGITQHIGAYTVELPQGKITFLDTPGHEAFTTMRSRGAKVTDIVILVVAADDGMMPQTEESIDHARAAGVPIIVAVNKIDKPEANPEKIKRQLSEKGLLSEEWGGDVIFNHVSAKNRTGITELLESILLQAEVLELKAPVETKATGTVLEAKLDRNRGALATFLVQSGTLRVGEYIVAGTTVGKVRAMIDWKANQLKDVGPSTAVEILGLEGVPDAGDAFNVVATEADARAVVENRIQEKRKQEQSKNSEVTLETLFTRMKAGELTELNVILKTDVHGSLEAIRDAVLKLGNDEVKAKVIHASVGGINESDVRLAVASKAIIIGFNVRPETNAIHSAKEAKVEIKLYKIIYDLVNEVKLAMQGLLKPEIKENYLGRVEVRQVFELTKIGVIAGSMVVDGIVTRTSKLRLLRDNVVIHEGEVGSLRRFKDDAREVKQGFECGVSIAGYGDVKVGDVIEAFEIVEIKKTL